MELWQKHLRVDPVPCLLSKNEALTYFVKRDLLGEDVEPIQKLWELPIVLKTLKKQQEDGSWKYHGGKEYIRSSQNYNQLETYRILGILVEKYGLTKNHPAIEKAAHFLFSFQTDEGDFRGIYGNQYTPNYTGGIMELLIKAGYENDPRIEKGFQWLLSMRQEDGSWAIPVRTVKKPLDTETMHAPTIDPDKSKPSAHMETGCILRAFAAHPRYSKRGEAQYAGEFLASRFFKRDTYPGRHTVDFWTRFSFPFWFTDLLSALDSLSLLKFTTENPHIREALAWFATRQQKNGLWNVKLLKGGDKELIYWVSLAICRVLKRYCR